MWVIAALFPFLAAIPYITFSKIGERFAVSLNGAGKVALSHLAFLPMQELLRRFFVPGVHSIIFPSLLFPVFLFSWTFNLLGSCRARKGQFENWRAFCRNPKWGQVGYWSPLLLSSLLCSLIFLFSASSSWVSPTSSCLKRCCADASTVPNGR